MVIHRTTTATGFHRLAVGRPDQGQPTWTLRSMPWTYILECADGSFYVGSTTDLDRRVGEHNDGLGAAYTRRPGRRPVKLVWAADFYRKDEAFAFEKRVQGWTRKKKLALIDNRWDLLPALASRAWRFRHAGDEIRDPLADDAEAGD